MIQDIRSRLEESGLRALASAFSNAEVEHVVRYERTHKVHPLAWIMRAAEPGSDFGRAVAYNTELAIRRILERQPDWFDGQRKRLTAPDFEDASSALGELRAFGAMLFASGQTTPVRPSRKAPTPDFQVAARRSLAVIEVLTKQMNGKEATKLAKFLNAPPQRFPIPGIGVSDTTVSPAGTKEGHTSAENLASKLAGIAQNSKKRRQAHSATGAAVLWLDLQDPDWWVVKAQDTSPFRTWHGAIHTFGLWHGFYGANGTPFFEGVRLHQGRQLECDLPVMQHPGFFAQAPWWSAVIISAADGITLFENPTPTVTLPAGIKDWVFELPGFSFERSWMDYPPGSGGLAERIASQQDLLRRLREHARRK